MTGVMRPAAGMLVAALLLSPADRCAAGEKHLLWAVQGGEATVYLMGSIHLLTPESYPLDDIMEEAYRRSDSVMFESDLGELSSGRHAGRLLAKGMYLDGRSLADDISQETMSLLREKARSLDIAPREILAMKPWFCSLTLFLKGLQKKGLDPNYGLDSHFYIRARLDGKKLVFLESPDFQMHLLSSLADGDQEELLRQTLRDEGLFTGGFDGLYRAWREGDDEWLAEYMAATLGGSPGLRKTFIDDRNRSWINPIEELLAKGTDSLVVVGAGHLVGEGSVVELLRRRGWDVRRL